MWFGVTVVGSAHALRQCVDTICCFVEGLVGAKNWNESQPSLVILRCCLQHCRHAVMLSPAPQNDDYRYLTCYIDVLSKEVRAVLMKKTKALDMARALHVVFDSTASRFVVTEVDKGTEFHTPTVKNKLKKIGIGVLITITRRRKHRLKKDCRERWKKRFGAITTTTLVGT